MVGMDPCFHLIPGVLAIGSPGSHHLICPGSNCHSNCDVSLLPFCSCIGWVTQTTESRHPLIKNRELFIKIFSDQASVETANDYTKRNFVFRLHAPDGSEFLFGADSEEQQEEWVSHPLKNPFYVFFVFHPSHWFKLHNCG